MRNVLVLAILACLALPLTSHAQLFVAGGVSFPVSPEDVNDFYSSGFGATAGFGLDLPLIPITPRVWANYDNFAIDEDELNFDVDGGNIRAITVGADAQFVMPMGPLSPYVAPAAGLTFLSVDDVEAAGLSLDLGDSESAFTLGVGAGLVFNLIVGPQLFLDARVLYAFTSGDNFMWAPIRLGITL